MKTIVQKKFYENYFIFLRENLSGVILSDHFIRVSIQKM